ncbi:hypothetical protein H9Y04_01765 [Streptomyces sp. TRM66268-LWL]|uniref:Protein phosphatase 2C-like protein n=1 Tax=Streptomyces polyasparticus TaxID=2767826 RepID=A0ABR7SAA9_9ACTN|nr:hypothetical protein [Streptomyces polyasparticus]MBC9711298.1 hypothetical protein [Streptomyces polyasparticus]
MRVELCTEPGNPARPNEDFASVALPASGQGGALVVLDGVTPPEGDDGCVHDVPWFVARLGGALCELSVSRRDMTLAEILSAAIGRTADAHRTTCDLSHSRTPQATVVLARWDAETVEHLVLSDSALLVESPDGEVDVVLDRRLDTLPERVTRARSLVRSLPEGTPERAAAVQAYVAEVESLRNAEDGFFTAAADPSAAFRAITGSRARADVRTLAGLTDGATRWVEKLGEGDWTECFAYLRKAGPQGLVDRVRVLERERVAAGVRVGGKAHDDATAVWVEL